RREKIVVITGASSGIGRATALELARRGAKLVLAARRREALRDTARSCGWHRAQVAAVECDVSDAAEVLRVAALAIDLFGRIDVWINNAGVYAMGAFDEVPEEVHERIFEVNYFGVVNGARAALPHLRESRGVLLNVNSALGRVGSPYLTAYVASKHAVRGFSEALRDEERRNGVAV